MTNDGRIVRAADLLQRARVEGPLALDAAALVEAVARNIRGLPATRHPLGFIHVDLTPLVSVSRHGQLRLHIWMKESESQADDLGLVHDHVWEGKSFLLTGSLTNSLLRVIRSSTGPYMMSEVIYRDGAQFVDPIEKGLDLEEIERKRVDEGSWYFLPRRVIHTTTINRYPTASLILTKCLDTERPRLISRTDPGLDPRVRENVPIETTTSALTEVLHQICRR